MAVVTGVLREGTQVAIRARDVTWLGDEPTGGGSADTGPTPYDAEVFAAMTPPKSTSGDSPRQYV